MNTVLNDLNSIYHHHYYYCHLSSLKYVYFLVVIQIFEYSYFTITQLEKLESSLAYYQLSIRKLFSRKKQTSSEISIWKMIIYFYKVLKSKEKQLNKLRQTI